MASNHGLVNYLFLSYIRHIISHNRNNELYEEHQRFVFSKRLYSYIIERFYWHERRSLLTSPYLRHAVNTSCSKVRVITSKPFFLRICPAVCELGHEVRSGMKWSACGEF
jgi:hypothetical protein